MSNPFADELRSAAALRLPEGAFLRRDRGDALYATDAPRRAPDADWQGRFEAAGFECAVAGGLARLTPGERWLQALAARYPEPPDLFCASLARFDGGGPGPEALRLFAMGVKALEGAGDPAAFDRALRQRAAQCLRDARQSGAGLYACALLDHLIEREYGK